MVIYFNYSVLLLLRSVNACLLPTLGRTLNDGICLFLPQTPPTSASQPVSVPIKLGDIFSFVMVIRLLSQGEATLGQLNSYFITLLVLLSANSLSEELARSAAQFIFNSMSVWRQPLCGLSCPVPVSPRLMEVGSSPTRGFINWGAPFDDDKEEWGSRGGRTISEREANRTPETNHASCPVSADPTYLPPITL